MEQKMNLEELINTFIEIEPIDSDTFFKVKETLTRIGLTSRKNKDEKPILWQSCHILQKRGHYYLLSFKQCFLLDGRFRRTDITEEDIDRIELIANLLEEWGLVKNKEKFKSPENVSVVIIPYRDKDKYQLKAKYTVGKKKSPVTTESEVTTE